MKTILPKKQIVRTVLRHIPGGVCLIFLFGSLVKNKPYPSSDIDIGLVCEKPLPNPIMVKIKQELKEVSTLRDIDVVDFTACSDKNFLKIALREVEIWHQTKKSKPYLNNLRKLI